MTQLSQIWKCNICGNIVEVLHAGADSLVCCGQPMELKNPQTEDPKLGEKHVPVLTKDEEEKTLVKIGSVEHPMSEEHYIEWIALGRPEKNKTCRGFLKPGDKPECKFCEKGDNFSARAYCNLHGLWEAKGKDFVEEEIGNN